MNVLLDPMAGDAMTATSRVPTRIIFASVMVFEKLSCIITLRSSRDFCDYIKLLKLPEYEGEDREVNILKVGPLVLYVFVALIRRDRAAELTSKDTLQETAYSLEDSISKPCSGATIQFATMR